jgi:hypothetical protein
MMKRRRSTIDGIPALCRLLLLALTALLGSSAPAPAAELSGFTSDGCSLFPDGTISERRKWCECRFEHDIAYWKGGTEQERMEADAALRDCVRERTGDKRLAETMYLGVRAGGHPAFPTWYRWGYGWGYGRGYAPLTDEERDQARAKREAYRKGPSRPYCMGE